MTFFQDNDTLRTQDFSELFASSWELALIETIGIWEAKNKAEQKFTEDVGVLQKVFLQTFERKVR
jgi:hypothetical protein